jgi:hypothetical protein
MPGWRALAPQARRPDQPDRLQRRPRLDVEAHPVALLDRGDRPLAGPPGERRGEREARADRRDAREDEPEPARDHGEGADRPESGQGCAHRVANLRQRGRHPGLGENRGHRLGGAARPAQD